MADIRIKDLAITATSAASDDYLALDGAANGTRKILASNIAQNVSDVVLGTNGPSVKSSLDARAARQGLVFAGTSGASVSVPAFGTADFTVHAIVNPASVASQQAIVAAAPNTGFNLYVLAGGVVRAQSGNAAQFTDSTTALTAGKTAAVTVVRSSGTTTIYINAISDASKADTYNYNNAIDSVGQYNSGQFFNGAISGVAIYNRALSASEVVSLFEAGVPSGADYNSASNTAINTGFANSGLAYTTFSGASATGFTATSNGSGLHIAWMTPQAVSLTPGQRFLVTLNLTLNSGTAPSVSFGATPTVNNLKSNVQLLTAGANSFVLTATAGGTSDLYFYNNSTATNYSVSSVSVTRLGLLLAPDAGQAGGGLTWYDTSGNAANITLPASGVSWNVPTSGKIATNFSVGGTLTVSDQVNFATGKYVKLGTSFFAVQDNVSGTNYLFSGGSGGLILRNGNDSATLGVLTNGGNLLLGTTTDSSNGKLQLATHTTSAGGIGFGTDTSFNRIAAGKLALTDSGSTPTFSLYASSTERARIEASGADVYISSVNASANLYLRSGNLTTALTLDSSQRCILSGALRLANSYVATPQVSTGYVTIQDSTGTTYKVLVAP